MSDQRERTEITIYLKRIIDKCKLTRYQSILIDLFTPILAQYILICNGNGRDWHSCTTGTDFDFWYLLERSMHYSVKSMHIKEQIRCLNALAAKWDQEISKVNKPSYTRSHVFFLCDCDVQTHAEIFLPEAPPDIRLICIHISNEDNRQPALAFQKILHEVGHYIGFRNREDRILPFIASISYELCNQIYLCYMKLALNTSIKQNIPPNIEDDKYVAAWIKELSFDLRSILGKSFNNVFASIYSRYKENHKAMLHEASQYWTESQRTRAIQAIERGYFCFLTPIMYQSVLEILEMQICTLIDLTMLDPQRTSCSFIEGHKLDVFKSIRDEISTSKSTWIDSCEKQFTEPIADLFMIKLSRLPMHKYIQLLLNSAYTSWIDTPNRQSEFIHYLSNDVFLPRIISVLLNVYSAQIDLPNKNNGLFAKFTKFKSIGLSMLRLTHRSTAISDAYDMLCEIVELALEQKQIFKEEISFKIQNIFNPLLRTQDYFCQLTKPQTYWNRFAEPEEIRRTFQKNVFPHLKPTFLMPLWKTPLGNRIIDRIID